MSKLKAGDEVPEEIEELFVKRRKYLQAGRVNYKRADAVMNQLLEQCEVGVSVTLDPTTKKGKPETHTLVDLFADKNEQWVGRAAKRFDIEVKAVKAQDTDPA